eukprot:XP_016659821.1 PREDICTED: uncharacterized protein LOC107883731 [Acyrthosiphon pisum]
MSFISCIIVLNVSIILMMIIAFSNITFVYQIQSLKLYQLANFTDPDYEVYLLQGIKPCKIYIYVYILYIMIVFYLKFGISNNLTWCVVGKHKVELVIGYIASPRSPNVTHTVLHDVVVKR